MLFWSYCSHMKRDDGRNSLLLSYCIIDWLSIMTNCLFTCLLIVLVFIVRKYYVIKNLKAVKFNEQKIGHSSNYYGLIDILLIGLTLTKFLFLSELMLIWNLYQCLFLTNLLSVISSLVTAMIGLLIKKVFIERRNLLSIVLFIYWLLSLFCSLSEFVIISLYSRDNYYQIMRVYITFISFLIYSILAFGELSAILNPVSIYDLIKQHLKISNF